MITLDLSWVRKELAFQIENTDDDSIFIHEKLWSILNWDDTQGTERLKTVAKKRNIKLIIGHQAL